MDKVIIYNGNNISTLHRIFYNLLGNLSLFSLFPYLEMFFNIHRFYSIHREYADLFPMIHMYLNFFYSSFQIQNSIHRKLSNKFGSNNFNVESVEMKRKKH